VGGFWWHRFVSFTGAERVRGSVGRRLVRAIPGGVSGEVVRRMGEKWMWDVESMGGIWRGGSRRDGPQSGV
jgi:hypothetical protein